MKSEAASLIAFGLMILLICHGYAHCERVDAEIHAMQRPVIEQPK